MTLLADPVARHPQQRVPLVDLLDRVLGKGVVVSGDLSICIAEVELVRLSLRVLLSSIRAEVPGVFSAPPPDPEDRRLPVGVPPRPELGPPGTARGRPWLEQQ